LFSETNPRRISERRPPPRSGEIELDDFGRAFSRTGIPRADAGRSPISFAIAGREKVAARIFCPQGRQHTRPASALRWFVAGPLLLVAPA